MYQPARLPINSDQTSESYSDSAFAVPVAVLRIGNQASFCAIQNVAAAYVQVELFSDVIEGETVSVHVGDIWSANGTIAVCNGGMARIDLHTPLDVETTMQLSAVNDSDRRRALPRVDAAARVRVKFNRRTIAARLHNISTTGARISASSALVPSAPILLTLPDYGDLHGFVCWSNNKEAGLRFKTPIAVDALAAWLSSRIRVSYCD